MLEKSLLQGQISCCRKHTSKYMGTEETAAVPSVVSTPTYDALQVFFFVDVPGFQLSCKYTLNTRVLKGCLSHESSWRESPLIIAVKPAQTCSLEELPQHLLQNVLHECWSSRPKQRPASAEVRHVLQLQGVCRRFSRLLLEQPLLLELDFSNTLLGDRHLHWLASPAWANRVEALTLYGWEGQTCHGKGCLLEQVRRTGADPASRQLHQGPRQGHDALLRLLRVLANQQGALQRLHGVPSKHGYSTEWCGRVPPPVDLSMFKLTHAGITCTYFETELKPTQLPRLPPTLVSLQYCINRADVSMFRGTPCLPQCVSGTLLDAARVLPSLAHISFTGNLSGVDAEVLPADGVERITIATEHKLSMFTWLHDREGLVRKSLFSKAQTVHLLARELELWPDGDDYEFESYDWAQFDVHDVDAMPRFFCPDTLNEAVIVTRSAFPVYKVFGGVDLWGWRLVMRILIAARASLFAFEVRDDAGDKCVAWRRWPPQGTPAHEAAARLHAEAVRWASEGDED